MVLHAIVTSSPMPGQDWVPMEPADLLAELWRLILPHLRLPELGRCSVVCRGWRQLVLSLDRTCWRQLCLGVLQITYMAAFLTVPVDCASDNETFLTMNQPITTSGYVRFDNCRFEGGHLQIHAPGTCPVKFCTFSRSSVHLHSVALCVLESCEFVGSENASVTVEGCPSSDCSWACEHLAVLAKSRAASWREPSQPGRTVGGSRCWGRGERARLSWGRNRAASSLLCVLQPCAAQPRRTVNLERTCGQQSRGGSQPSARSSDSDLLCNSEEDAQAAHRLPCQAHATHRRLLSDRLHTFQRDLQLKPLQQELQQDKEARSLASSLQGCIIRQCLFKDGRGRIFVYSQGQAKLEGSIFRDLTCAVRCIRNSEVIMLRNDVHHCKASGVFLHLSGGLMADNNIHSNGAAGVDIRNEPAPVFRCCNKIHSGLCSGIVVVDNGKGIIRSNRIYGNKEAGIYVLYNGNPAVRCVS
ncbi:LOW QUALITY PROTEIN: F-box only protein 10 [Patagioenas fasciata]|uniref:LOW QUALITY PROTEIN: F-box only protein 10 n=1 Tax=Patagioenas fasciata TaxID=372321 RepID=UPI003A9A527F